MEKSENKASKKWSLNPRPITVNRDKMLKMFLDRGTSLEELSEIVRPMRDMTQEEKETYAAKILRQYETK